MIIFNLFLTALGCWLGWQVFTSPSRARGRACAVLLTVVVIVGQCANGKL